MVKEKQRLRQKNSSFIARAVIENNEKFKIIEDLYKEHKELCKTKDSVMAKILKVYGVGFKNFSRRKKLIGVIDGNSYYISPKGIVRAISQRQRRNNRTEDIIRTFISRSYTGSVYHEIFRIGINREELRKNMNLNQKKIFTKFFKYGKYAREEKRVLLKIPLTKVIELAPGFVKPFGVKDIDSIYLLNHGIRNEEFEFIFSHQNVQVSTIRFNRLYVGSGINEKIFIEQTFVYLKALLEKEIRNRKRELKRLNYFYTKVKKEFADYILLEAIERE